MGKRRGDPGQLAFGFDVPSPALAGSLAGDDARVSRMVADILHGDPRPREIIAAQMSLMLDADVSKAMLDAYASPGRADHSISYSRMKALIAVTTRHDLLDRDMRSIGAALLVGEEIRTARLGHLRARKAELEAEIRAVERSVQPIQRAKRAAGDA